MLAAKGVDFSTFRSDSAFRTDGPSPDKRTDGGAHLEEQMDVLQSDFNVKLKPKRTEVSLPPISHIPLIMFHC
jgi:hypothetical protein